MTNDDLEKLFKSKNGLSHTAALRLVYDAGYHAGAGTNPATVAEPSYGAAPPTEAYVTAMQKKVDK
jgi:hypothetical protein